MITSKSNSLIKLARELRQRRARDETGRFLIEGLQPVGAAIEAGWEIEALLHAPGLLTSSFGKALIAGHRGRLEAVSDAVLESISGKENPQGIIAIAKKRPTSLGSTEPRRCGVGLISPQDPGNLGTILRTMDAVGASCLYLVDGGVDPYHPTAIRASMGASFVVPVVEAELSAFLEWRQAKGIHLIGTSARAGRDFHEVKPRAPWILLLGSEQKGLSDSQRRACDVTVTLPMRGRSSSLNLAVAAGILLYSYTG